MRAASTSPIASEPSAALRASHVMNAIVGCDREQRDEDEQRHLRPEHGVVHVELGAFQAEVRRSRPVTMTSPALMPYQRSTSRSRR